MSVTTESTEQLYHDHPRTDDYDPWELETDPTGDPPRAVVTRVRLEVQLYTRLLALGRPWSISEVVVPRAFARYVAQGLPTDDEIERWLNEQAERAVAAAGRPGAVTTTPAMMSGLARGLLPAQRA